MLLMSVESFINMGLSLCRMTQINATNSLKIKYTQTYDIATGSTKLTKYYKAKILGEEILFELKYSSLIDNTHNQPYDKHVLNIKPFVRYDTHTNQIGQNLVQKIASTNNKIATRFLKENKTPRGIHLSSYPVLQAIVDDK